MFQPPSGNCRFKMWRTQRCCICSSTSPTQCMKRTKSEQSVLSTSNSPHQWPSGCCCRSRFSWARLIACEISVSSAEYDSTSCGLALDNEITSLDRLMIVDLLIADRTFVDLKMLAPPRLQRVCP